jgi:hypothetical protein
MLKKVILDGCISITDRLLQQVLDRALHAPQPTRPLATRPIWSTKVRIDDCGHRIRPRILLQVGNQSPPLTRRSPTRTGSKSIQKLKQAYRDRLQ